VAARLPAQIAAHLRLAHPQLALLDASPPPPRMSDAADSSLSASQLRQRYLKGGTARDDELSAAQLRARHGIAANPREFSTSQWRRSVLASPLALAAFVAVVMAAFAGALYYILAGR
jgi:hypothetical protein